MMQLVTFRENLTCGFRKSSGGAHVNLEANRAYLMSHQQVTNVLREQRAQERIHKMSLAQPRLANFNVAALRKGQRVLLYNASGGYGDQIVTWPVAKYLAELGAAVHILTEPGNNVCWWNLPFVRTVNTLPIPWETVKMFDHQAFFDSVTNIDEHEGQEHPVDAMLRRIGLDPDEVPAEKKCVRPVFTGGETGTLQKYKEKRFGMYQLSASMPLRSLPANDSVYVAVRLAESTPDIHWLCLHDEFVAPAYSQNLLTEVSKRGLSNVEVFSAENLRELWALTEHARVVVAPDSMMVHVAGSLGVPCVGLWGPIPPENRVRYYANHHPIHHRQNCPHAPCFAYTPEFPRYCPPRPGRNVCDVLASIGPLEIIDLVKKVAR